LLFLGLLIGLPAIAGAQFTDFAAHTYTGDEGGELNYRMLEPVDYDSTKSYPLVLFLHGAGERGDDNFSQLKWGVHHFADPGFREKYPAFVVAPQVPEGNFWSTLELVRASTSFIMSIRYPSTEPMRF